MKRIFLGMITFIVLAANAPISAMDDNRRVQNVTVPSKEYLEQGLITHGAWLYNQKTYDDDAVRYFRTAALSKSFSVSNEAQAWLTIMHIKGHKVDGQVELVRFFCQ